MEKKKYVPVLIPTLCRDKHFIRCIESLKRNSWAKYTDVFIGVDYPLKSEHMQGYNNICRYLEGDFKEFNSFTIFKRKENWGSVRNNNALVNFVKNKYPYYARTDDDTEFSPNYLEYLNKQLWEHENDPRIVAITAYSHPIEWEKVDGCDTFIQNYAFNMWGTAIYVDKFNKIQEDIMNDFFKKNFKSIISCKSYKKLVKSKQISLVNYTLIPENGVLDCTTDVACGIYIALNDLYVVTPYCSKVRNWGFDGTGEYCENLSDDITKDLYSSQTIDESRNYELLRTDIEYCNENQKLFDVFQDVSAFNIFKMNIKIFLFKLLGINAYLKIQCWLNRI